MTVRAVAFLAVAAGLSVSVTAASASGTVTLQAGHSTSVQGHLQGASPSAPVYAPQVADTCLANACDATTLNLRLPKGKRGDLSVTAKYAVTGAHTTLRIFDAKGTLVASEDAGGAAVTASPTQGVHALARNLPAGSYTARLYLAAGTTDFTETFKWTLAR